MIGPIPYFTFWQIAEKWAEELKKPIMEMIQLMRVHATYKYPYPIPCPVPALLIRPTTVFSAQGEVNEFTIFNAHKMIEKDQTTCLDETLTGSKLISKYRAKYRTPEYNAAEAFFNSSECPPEPTEIIKEHLSLFAILRDDFRDWCLGEGEPLPKFWFPLNEAEKSNYSNKSTMKKCNLPDRKGVKVPEGERRKTEDFTKTINSLFNQLIKEGNIEVLKPRQIDAFLKCLRDRTKGLDKLEEGVTSYGELVKEVKIGNPKECILMDKPRVVRGKKGRELKWYTRKDIIRHLSELRKVLRENFHMFP